MKSLEIAVCSLVCVSLTVSCTASRQARARSAAGTASSESRDAEVIDTLEAYDVEGVTPRSHSAESNPWGPMSKPRAEAVGPGTAIIVGATFAAAVTLILGGLYLNALSHITM